MEVWDCTLSTIVVRALAVYLTPPLLHVLDVAANSDALLRAYESKPWRVFLIWSLICCPLFGVVYELACPEAEEDLPPTPRTSKAASLGFSALAFLLLYQLVFRRVFSRRRIRAKSI